MKELLEKMQDIYETFKANATLQLEKQNKAAGGFFDIGKTG